MTRSVLVLAVLTVVSHGDTDWSEAYYDSINLGTLGLSFAGWKLRRRKEG